MCEFTLKEGEKKSDKKVVKEKIREPWRKRAREKKSKFDKKNRKNDIGTFELSDKENPSADEDDVRWNFGVSNFFVNKKCFTVSTNSFKKREKYNISKLETPT